MSRERIQSRSLLRGDLLNAEAARYEYFVARPKKATIGAIIGDALLLRHRAKRRRHLASYRATVTLIQSLPLRATVSMSFFL